MYVIEFPSLCINLSILMKNLKSNSWTVKIRTMLLKYDLPTAYKLYLYPPPKYQWKKMVNGAVHNYWEGELKEEARSMLSLCYLNIEDCNLCNVHVIWMLVEGLTFI